MRLIDADELMERLSRMDDLISRSALLAAYDKAHQGPPGGARKLIEEAPTAEAEPARLLTPEDWENNPDVDSEGYLPAWCDEYVDCDLLESGWTVVCVEALQNRGRRYWTKRPTREQMEATPWP